MGWGPAPTTQLIIPSDAGPNDPRVEIGPVVPPELVAFYAPNLVTSCMLGYADGTRYQYTVWLFIAATGEEAIATGWVTPGPTIYEAVLQYLDPASGIPRSLSFGDAFGSRTDGSAFRFQGATAGGSYDSSASDYSLHDIGAFVDSTIESVSQPRGLRDLVTSVANTAAIAGETIVMTSAAIVWSNLRCYEIDFSHFGQASVPNFCDFLIRRTNLLGAIKGQVRHEFTANGGTTVLGRCFIRNVSGADITDNIVLTVAASAGTLTGVGNANNVRALRIRDCGAAADYPNVAQI